MNSIIRFKVNTRDIDLPKNIIKLSPEFFVSVENYSDTGLIEEFVIIDKDDYVISYNVSDITWEKDWKFLEKYRSDN